MLPAHHCLGTELQSMQIICFLFKFAQVLIWSIAWELGRLRHFTVLTLLNFPRVVLTAGITLPKLAIFACMDLLTVRRCQSTSGSLQGLQCPGGRVEAQGSNSCTDAGGTCSLTFDGFYPLSAAMITLGVVLSFHYKRVMPELEALPRTHWRAPAGKSN